MRPRPARCSKTRWRVDGEALGAERPSCSLGHLPIKAGTLLLTHTRLQLIPPTQRERERETPPETPTHYSDKTSKTLQ